MNKTTSILNKIQVGGGEGNEGSAARKKSIKKAARRARRARPHPHYSSTPHPLPTPTPIPQVVDTWLNNTYIPKANRTSPLAGAEYTLNQKLTNAVKVREGGGWGGGGDNVFFCFFRPHPPSFPPSLSPSP